MNRESISISLYQDDTWCMDKLHFHESIEVLLSLSDGGDFFIGKEMYHIRKNTIFLLDSAVLHRTVHEKKDTPYRRYIMHILPSKLEEISTPQTNFVRCFQRAKPCTVIGELRRLDLMTMFRQLVEEPGSAFGDDVRYNIRLQELLLQLCDAWEASTTEVGAVDQGYEKVQPVLRYLQDHLTENVTLDEVAKNFAISKYHLSHLFKKATGFSVMDYVIQRRIILARELLRDQISVQEAGERAGFRNNSHFIRTFTNCTGMSPKRYARQYLKSDKYDTLVGRETNK